MIKHSNLCRTHHSGHVKQYVAPLRRLNARTSRRGGVLLDQFLAILHGLVGRSSQMRELLMSKLIQPASMLQSAELAEAMAGMPGIFSGVSEDGWTRL